MSERASFNAALASLHKMREFQRIWRKVDHRIDVMGEADAIKLLREIEQLL